MKSFGVWFKYPDKDNNANANENKDNNTNNNKNKDSNANANNKDNNINDDNKDNNANNNDNKDTDKNKYHDVNIDLHINLWDIEKLKKENYIICKKFNSYKYIDPFIDVGIMIDDFTKIEQISFLIPFDIERKDLINLKDTFSRDNITNLIFNENCEVVNDHSEFVTYIKLNEENILIYDFDDFDIENSNVNIITVDNETLVKFKICEIMKSNSNLEKYSKLYIRFRIKSNKIKDELFRKIKNVNFFLETGFVTKKIIDLKVNKKRNINIKWIKQLRKEEFDFAKFNKIHFLVMEPAANSVEIIEKNFLECRKIEKDWEGYLKIENNLKMEDVLAYHWKAKSENVCDKIGEFGILVKATGVKSTWKTVIIYILAIIVINLLSNGLYSGALPKPVEFIRNLLKFFKNIIYILIN